jgi:site-specific recombinase XerD
VKLATTNPAQTLQGVKQGRRVPKALSTQEIYRRQRTAHHTFATRLLREAGADLVTVRR